MLNTIIRTRFEVWFNKKFEWEINRRKYYSLKRDVVDGEKYACKFTQEHWETWQRAVNEFIGD